MLEQLPKRPSSCWGQWSLFDWNEDIFIPSVWRGDVTVSLCIMNTTLPCCKLMYHEYNTSLILSSGWRLLKQYKQINNQLHKLSVKYCCVVQGNRVCPLWVCYNVLQGRIGPGAKDYKHKSSSAWSRKENLQYKP